MSISDLFILHNILRIRCWAIFVVFTISSIFYGQDQVTFRNLSVTDGLSQNSVIDMVQDSLGYLWLATQDGLNRYDGREFKSYPYQFLDITRPNFNQLGQLYVDNDGTLWAIPLDKKLHFLPKDKGTFQTLDDVKNVYTIYQDQSKNHWVGTHNGEVYIKPSGTDIFEEHLKGSFEKKPIIQFLHVSKNSMLILTRSKILLYDHKNHKRIRSWKLDIENESSFSKITWDVNNNYIVATYNAGLFKLNPLLPELVPLDLDLPKNTKIIDVWSDSKNRIWAGTYGQGLYVINSTSGKTTHFTASKTNNRSIHYNDILSIYEDQLGVVWFGTDGGGVSYFDEYLEKFNSKINTQTSENIHVDVVRSITTDNQGHIWIGTSGKGLTQYHPETDTFVPYSEQLKNLPSDRIMSLLYDSKGNLWLGTQGKGLWILSDEGAILNPNQMRLSLPKLNTIWAIFEDASNNIWLGTRDNGLIKLNISTKEIEQFVYNGTNNGIPSNNVRVITSDSNGNIWIGTENNGIAKLNPNNKHIEVFSTSSQKFRLVSNSIKSLNFDDEKTLLYIGTNGQGLDILDFNTQTTRTITTEQGLANNVIYGIVPDSNNHLWLSSNKGISRLSWTASDSLPEITNYYNYDGLATEFNTGAWHKSRKGTIYFGGLDGFYWFDPSKIKTNKKLPKTQITGFTVEDTDFPLGNNAVLSYHQNTLSFTFSSMQFSLPVKNAYQYRLLNYEEDWVNSGNNTYARYSKLPPGNYTFMVKSSNYDGIWNPQVAKFEFVIKPPWYWNTLSKSIYFLLGLGLIYTLFRYLKWRWKIKIDLQLKEQETIRLQRLNDYKAELYTHIAHEFKTPLTLIASPIDEMISTKTLTKELKEKLQFVDRSTERLTNLVDQLLQMARLEEGKYVKKPQHGDLESFMKSLITSYRSKANEKQIQLNQMIAPMPWVWYDEDMVEKILANLITNAIKYAPPRTSCLVTTKLHQNTLVLEVKNSYPGEIDTNKIFDRFYRAEQGNEGIGIGLSLVKELVTQFNGKIEAVKENNTLLMRAKWMVSRSIFSEEELKDTKTLTTSLDTHHAFEETKEKRQLLLVEDDKDTMEYMVASLKNTYDLLLAEDGQKGLEEAIAKIPDIIISDIKMPVKNGLDLCLEVKNDPRTGHIPIILLTANSNETNQAKAMKIGVEDFIAKPFKIQQIKQRIENILMNRNKMAEYYTRNGVIDPKMVQVTSIEGAFLEKVQEIMGQHLMDTYFNAGEMSKLMGLSRMQLHRKLQAYTGLSTSAFIRSQRLKLASDLLVKTDQTVNEVAYAVGFNTPDYFMKCFKAQYQLTPSEFKQQHKKG